jgi:hypothetical protein
MDVVWFILILAFLVFIMFVLNKLDRMTKNKYRRNAYTLLETENPDTKEIKDTIKGLRLYGGRLRKDEEFQKLIKELQDKLYSIEGEY